MHRYRSHTCGVLRATDIGETVRLAGWVHRVRDHGGLLFIDLRDRHGLTQVVARAGHPTMEAGSRARSEYVLAVRGHVVARDSAAVNVKFVVLPTIETLFPVSRRRNPFGP